MFKVCKRCGVGKPPLSFYSKDSSCKICRLEAVRLYRANNLERIRDYDRARGKQPHRIAASIATTRRRRTAEEGYTAAHNAVARALRSGRLVKGNCCMCGSPENIHAHHDNYSKPLEVLWLCAVHHKARHAFLDYQQSDCS